jgi:hypothetical protein
MAGGAGALGATVFVAIGFVVAAVAGFVAGMHTVRRRVSLDNREEDQIEMGSATANSSEEATTHYVMS